MGYDITIVRKIDWEDPEEDSDITLEEWLNYIATDQELEKPSPSSLTDDNREFYQQRPGYCEWTKHSIYKEPFARPRFDFKRGEIRSENVDDETMFKMISIAEQLNAKVQGQDGEFYDEDDAMKLKVTSQDTPPSQIPQNKKPWWKFW